jgi:hypothetical protein
MQDNGLVLIMLQRNAVKYLRRGIRGEIKSGNPAQRGCHQQFVGIGRLLGINHRRFACEGDDDEIEPVPIGAFRNAQKAVLVVDNDLPFLGKIKFVTNSLSLW